jgi:hypothetical protein
VLAGPVALARRAVEVAEAEVAVGDQRAHSSGLGERQRPAVMGLATLGVESVGMQRGVTEQVMGMCREARFPSPSMSRYIAIAVVSCCRACRR